MDLSREASRLYDILKHVLMLSKIVDLRNATSYNPRLNTYTSWLPRSIIAALKTHQVTHCSEFCLSGIHENFQVDFSLLKFWGTCFVVRLRYRQFTQSLPPISIS